MRLVLKLWVKKKIDYRAGILRKKKQNYDTSVEIISKLKKKNCDYRAGILGGGQTIRPKPELWGGKKSIRLVLEFWEEKITKVSD